MAENTVYFGSIELTRSPTQNYNPHSTVAEVVEWQTRTFEGRVGKPVRVQIPPSAPYSHYREPPSKPAWPHEIFAVSRYRLSLLLGSDGNLVYY